MPALSRPEIMMSQPSILFIDAYDSFTNNIISLLSTTLSCSVRVIHIDTLGLESDEALHRELRNYDAVVCGPGPGDPTNEEDVGIMNRLWSLTDDQLLPVLGICLGFQSLAVYHGGKIQKLKQGMHGMVRDINHIGSSRTTPESQRDIFQNVGEVSATLYHSLCINLGHNEQTDKGFETCRWLPGARSEVLQPIAWAETPDDADKRILMGIKHTEKPFWGLQYHPESICTNFESKKIIKNWAKAAQKWNTGRGRHVMRLPTRTVGQQSQRPSLLGTAELNRIVQKVRSNHNDVDCGEKRDCRPDWKCYEAYAHLSKGCHYDYRTLQLPERISVADVVEHMNGSTDEHIILESTNGHMTDAVNAGVRGRFSIIAMRIQEALKIAYQTGRGWYEISHNGNGYDIPPAKFRRPLAPHQSIWEIVASFNDERTITNGNLSTPFWGGFMGYTTYELGLESIDVARLSENDSFRPDLCFAWVSSSIVVDHFEKTVYLQSLRKPSDKFSWPEYAVQQLRALFEKDEQNEKRADDLDWKSVKSRGDPLIPSLSQYERKVETCQEFIREGNSYELCLTDQTHIVRERQDPFERNTGSITDQRGESLQPDSLLSSEAWQIYRSLRSRQPAPMASFLRLGPATFISASPERFLKWDASGKCELRPMKGTVKKTPEVSTLAQAEALLQVPKEQAENLMIVDLVRHDLYGVCGAGSVSVPRLMVVEEYASVFQMITVVEGHLPPSSRSKSLGPKGALSAHARYTGIDALAASLPPGSMTGAPKKRSCEILQQIEEGRERSLYSGVVGYIDVGGRGDFCVNIRCLFRWDDEVVLPGTGDVKNRISRLPSNEIGKLDAVREVWHAGAGGAVTALSTAVGEREEMQTKLAGTLALFERLSSENGELVTLG